MKDDPIRAGAVLDLLLALSPREPRLPVGPLARGVVDGVVPIVPADSLLELLRLLGIALRGRWSRDLAWRSSALAWSLPLAPSPLEAFLEPLHRPLLPPREWVFIFGDRAHHVTVEVSANLAMGGDAHRFSVIGRAFRVGLVAVIERVVIGVLGS
jgi:hypothetical protein